MSMTAVDGEVEVDLPTRPLGTFMTMSAAATEQPT
jgi:hypothetical protein